MCYSDTKEVLKRVKPEKISQPPPTAHHNHCSNGKVDQENSAQRVTPVRYGELVILGYQRYNHKFIIFYYSVRLYATYWRYMFLAVEHLVTCVLLFLL